jgi:hypothetical protein
VTEGACACWDGGPQRCRSATRGGGGGAEPPRPPLPPSPALRGAFRPARTRSPRKRARGHSPHSPTHPVVTSYDNSKTQGFFYMGCKPATSVPPYHFVLVQVHVNKLEGAAVIAAAGPVATQGPQDLLFFCIRRCTIPKAGG